MHGGNGLPVFFSNEYRQAVGDLHRAHYARGERRLRVRFHLIPFHSLSVNDIRAVHLRHPAGLSRRHLRNKAAVHAHAGGVI